MENQEQKNQTPAPQTNQPQTQAPARDNRTPRRDFGNRGPGGFRRDFRGGQGGGPGGKGGFRRGFGGPRGDRPEKLFDSKTIEISRVTRVTGGGKKLSFRSVVAIGDKKGRVGLGVAKGKDVAMANEKATRYAKRAMITVPMVGGTIPHEVFGKAGASEIMLKPQGQGRGIVAGGAARVLFSMAGIKNITAKYLGTTKNRLNNARAAFIALSKIKAPKASKKDEAKDQIAFVAPEDQIQE